MRKLLLAAIALSFAAAPALAQEAWVFDSASPYPDLDGRLGAGSGHGVAVDAQGRVWTQSYYASDSVLVNELVADGDNGYRGVRVLNVFNPDGSEASFSPIKFVTLPGGESDTLGGGLSRDANGNLAWAGNTGAGAFSGRGLRASSDGNAVYVSQNKTLYKIDATAGAATSANTASVLAVNTFPESCANTAAAVAPVDGGSELVFIAPVCPGQPLRVLDGSDLSVIENAIDETVGFSRSFEVSADGNKIYWAGYTNNAVALYERADEFSSFDSVGIVVPGVASESLTRAPNGMIWISAGSVANMPNAYEGVTTSWEPRTWYAFDPADLTVGDDITVPSAVASITWNDAAAQSGGAPDTIGRPRGLAFTMDGMTAYATQFSQAAPAYQKFNAPAAANYELTFAVDLSVKEQEGSFDPASDKVWVAGGFFGEDWGATKMELSDGDSDGVYTGSFQIMGLNAGSYGYKFIEGTEDKLGWEGDVNGDLEGEDRSLTLTGSETDNNSDGFLDVMVPQVFFNNDSEVNITHDYEILFQVDMSVQRARGAFDYDEDYVVVAGNFNGWNTTTDTLFQDTFGANPDIFSNVVQVDAFDISSPLYYKFVTDTDGDNTTAPDGWESSSVSTDPSGNRVLELDGTEPATGTDGRLEAQTPDGVFYNNVTADAIFGEGGGTVTFEVDLRPAYYFLADNGSLPSDTQTNDTIDSFSSLFINGPVVGESEADSFDDWAGWGPDNLGAVPERQLVDDGTKGDRVAGDSVFTITLSYPEGALKRANGKFGVDGYDNEAGFGGDHFFQLEDGATVSRIYGAVVNADGQVVVNNGPTNFETAYATYIQVSEDGTSATVRRRAPVAVEQISEDVPGTLTLAGNYPNPFRGETRFEFGLAASEHVTLQVYDLTGRVVATLVDQMLPQGTHEATFDATGLASGTYVYRLSTPSTAVTRKMLLVR